MKNILFLLIAILISAGSASPQFFTQKINQFKSGARNGLWISYIDTTKTQIERKGRFKHGTEKGTWRYYSLEGKLRKKEKFRKNGIFTTTYFPDGKKESSGIAVIMPEDSCLHYYYTGEWKYFNSSGELYKIIVYEKGRAMNSRVTK